MRHILAAFVGVCLAPAPAPPPADGGVNPAAAELLDLRAVQKELKLTPAQRVEIIDRVADAADDHAKAIDALRRANPTPNNRPLADALRQRDDALRAVRRQLVTGVLTAAQRSRLRQLDWQVRGPDAFADPAVTDLLQLTPAQRKAADVARELFRVTETRFRNAAIDGDESKAVGELLAARADAARDIAAALTPAQRREWADLLGEPATAVDPVGVYLARLAAAD